MLKLNKKLILASSSPRRSKILESLGFAFTIEKINFNEEYPQGLSLHEVPAFICNQKAKQLPILQNQDLYLTADTIVFSENYGVIGKPKDLQDAENLLKELSGKTHQVITGVCLKSLDFEYTFSEATEVTFYPLTDNEIKYYLKKFSPLDKAGAYGIQEWIGLIGIKKINGNYDNVVGLPASRLFQEMKKLNLFE